MSGSLVAVSWCMPPTVFPRSVQVARTLKGLRARGWQSTVITPALDSFPPALIDAALGAAYDRHYLVTRIDLSRVDQKHGPLAARWRERLNGDAAASDQELWIRRAAAAARHAVRNTHAAALITFAQPWTDHLVGLRVHERHPGLPWIAHFSDPWTDSLYSQTTGVEREQDLQREREVITGADVVVFTNQHAADLVMKKYSRTIAAKARVIPHAMDLEVAPVAPPRQGGPLRIAHVGNLFVGRRTATALFEALVALNARQPLAGRLEVVFVGEGSGLYEAQEQVFVHRLEPIVTFHPRVAYLESLRLMRESDLLLLIDAPSAVNVFLPSKIVDYFMAERPLLALTPPTGMSAEIATRLGYPMARPDDAPGIAAVLERLLLDHESGRLPAAAPAATLNEFSLDATAGAFDQVLAEAVAARRAA